MGFLEDDCCRIGIRSWLSGGGDPEQSWGVDIIVFAVVDDYSYIVMLDEDADGGDNYEALNGEVWRV